MSQQLFSLSSWPWAIIHIGGVAFFASCEKAIHPELKGKRLITGGECVIASYVRFLGGNQEVKIIAASRRFSGELEPFPTCRIHSIRFVPVFPDNARN